MITRRCQSLTHAGHPCQRPPLPGEALCWSHHPSIWRRRRHPLDYALDVLAARVERHFRHRGHVA